MKRKTLTLVLCLLTVMSLVGVGFASWVISADTSVEETGKIVVDTVTDNRLTLEVGTVANKDIVFTTEADQKLNYFGRLTKPVTKAGKKILYFFRSC